jgi:predicted DNA-binding protein YlxM (UPF0122 family)
MRLESIYKNTPYLFKGQGGDPDGEKLACNILKKIGHADPQNISVLSQGPNYDNYKADVEIGTICFKYSMDMSSPFFAREFGILKQLDPFCPIAHQHGSIKFGEPLQYLVSSYEYAENVKNHGIGSVLEHAESFAYSFFQMSKVQIDRTFAEYLKDFFSRSQISNLPEHSRESIQEHSDLKRLGSVLDSLKSEVNYLSQKSCLTKSEFCHGALKPSNILVRNGYFKFIDLNDGFMGNRFFDLASFFSRIGWGLDYQKQYISQLIHEDFSFEQIEEYNTCYNIAIRMIAYQAVFDYLIEVYLYENSRPQKLLEAVDLFARNEKALMSIPSLHKYVDFLFGDILEPIIGANKE